jgi:CBS domain-containing protein
MRAGEAIQRPVVVIGPDRTIADAARCMDERSVGSVVVVDAGRVVGVVTDRDVVVRGVARAVPMDARVDALMSTDVVTVRSDEDLTAVQPLFRRHDVRRVVVVDGDAPVGVLSVDDLVVDLVASLLDVVHPVVTQLAAERERSRVPSVAT